MAIDSLTQDWQLLQYVQSLVLLASTRCEYEFFTYLVTSTISASLIIGNAYCIKDSVGQLLQTSPGTGQDMAE